MSTHATALILGVSNFVSFPAGETENRLLLQLPNGQHIEAVISDEGLEAVARCFGAPQEPVAHAPTSAPDKTNRLDSSPRVETSSTVFEETTVDGAPAFVFGERPYEPEPAPAPPPPAPVVHQAPPPRKGRLVGKDSAGNPIIETPGAATTAEITGTTGDRDEDGVAQL